MPRISTVFGWLSKGDGDSGVEPYKTFLDNYARAREAQAEKYAAEIIDISDDSSEDEIFADVRVVVDKSNAMARYTAAKFLAKSRRTCAGRLSQTSSSVIRFSIFQRICR
jgi:hypothetical protein